MKKTIYSFLLSISFFSVKSLGVLTHEAIIDAAWDKSIVPLLKIKYPMATKEDLKIAHAYAYGGAVTPDMGYYPLGSHLFTDLVHYVRSGDMVNALLINAENLDQYAFALGFLSHYNADNIGHPMATNLSVPLVYKKMKKRFGDTTTYDENKISHIRMEFGFDVLQTAKGYYASVAYHDFIGFKIDTAVLSKAFTETYGLDINSVFSNHLQLTINFFRFVIANVFPVITRAAWASKSSELLKKDSTLTSKKFRYQMHVREYKKEYGKDYKHPGFLAGVLSVFIRVLPKAGPTRALRFKIPTPQAEKYFDKSFDTIEKNYTTEIKQLTQLSNLNLKDENFDTGQPTKMCDYMLADNTYYSWLVELEEQKFKNLNIPIQHNILLFFKQLNPYQNNKWAKKNRKFCKALKGIRLYNPA